ncbi:hypothetical protein [Streptomyces sp. NPDC058622]|uniref:hypothetical protein n=1 Tax=Streptomyces sp. NPDC058622 TaxID=3346562 RepID=UPI003649ECBF
MPGRIRTWDGLNKALNRIHHETGSPSRRALAASEGAAGRLSKSTIGNILNGKRPTAEQLAALYERILAGPPVRPAGLNRCDDIERANEEREAARETEEERLRYRGVAPAAEPDAYDQARQDEEEAPYRRWVAWVDSLSFEELEAVQKQNAATAASAAGSLRAELAAIVPPACPGP